MFFDFFVEYKMIWCKVIFLYLKLVIGFKDESFKLKSFCYCKESFQLFLFNTDFSIVDIVQDIIEFFMVDIFKAQNDIFAFVIALENCLEVVTG